MQISAVSMNMNACLQILRCGYNAFFFKKSDQHLHSLQCLSVQRSVLPVGPLGPACVCVSLQHHHPPLPPLHRPQQPVLPAPHGDATGGAGAQWHQAPYSRGKAAQQLLYLSTVLDWFHSVTGNSTSQEKEGAVAMMNGRVGQGPCMGRLELPWGLAGW